LARDAIRETRALEQDVVQSALRLRNLQRESACILKEGPNGPIRQDGRHDFVGCQPWGRVVQSSVKEERLIVTRDVLVGIAIEHIVHQSITGGAWVGLSYFGPQGQGL